MNDDLKRQLGYALVAHSPAIGRAFASIHNNDILLDRGRFSVEPGFHNSWPRKVVLDGVSMSGSAVKDALELSQYWLERMIPVPLANLDLNHGVDFIVWGRHRYAVRTQFAGEYSTICIRWSRETGERTEADKILACETRADYFIHVYATAKPGALPGVWNVQTNRIYIAPIREIQRRLNEIKGGNLTGARFTYPPKDGKGQQTFVAIDVDTMNLAYSASRGGNL